MLQIIATSDDSSDQLVGKRFKYRIPNSVSKATLIELIYAIIPWFCVQCFRHLMAMIEAKLKHWNQTVECEKPASFNRC